jgi:hypothetical protein
LRYIASGKNVFKAGLSAPEPKMSNKGRLTVKMLAALLMLLCGSAWADWYFIGKTHEFNMYADPYSIQRNGPIARTWVMGDYKVAQSQRFPPPLFWISYLSVKELKEFDCTKGLHRTARTAIYAANLAKGDPAYSFDSAANFAPVANTALDRAQFKFACEDGKR